MEALVSEFNQGTNLGWDIIIVRLLGAIVFSGVIGFEREARKRPAGLRTHMLVGLASASYCIIMLELLELSENSFSEFTMDPLRLLQAVTSGVAFLAAGLIVFSRGQVRGLTTGASLWLAAALGLGAGFGLWPLAALSTGLALIIIGLLKLAEDAAHAHPSGHRREDDTGDDAEGREPR